MTDEATLRELIRHLEQNNMARHAEIARLRKQIAALRLRLTRMQQTIERKNKEQK